MSLIVTNLMLFQYSWRPLGDFGLNSFHLTKVFMRFPDSVFRLLEKLVSHWVYKAFISFLDCLVSWSGTILIRNLHFPLVLQQNRQISANALFVRSGPSFGPFGDIFGPPGTVSGRHRRQRPSLRVRPLRLKRDFNQIGQPSSGRQSGNSIRVARPKAFLRAQKKSDSYFRLNSGSFSLF